MKFASSETEISAARDEERLRSFLAGNKIAFAQAFWENGQRQPIHRPESEARPEVVLKDGSN